LANPALIVRPRRESQALTIAVVAIAANAILGGVGLFTSGSSLVTGLNVVLPLVTMGALGVAGALLLRRDATVLISGVGVFLATCSLYFGLGPFLIAIATPDVVAAADIHFPLTPDMLLRTNVLNSVGVGGALGGLALLKYVFPNPRNRPIAVTLSEQDARSIWITLALLGFVGLMVKLTLVMPLVLGWRSSSSMGLVTAFAVNTHALTLFLWYLGANHRGFLLVGIAVLGLEAFLGFASLMKANVLFPLVIAGIGYGLGKPRAWKRLVLWGAGVLLVFVLLVPVIAQLRATHWGGATGPRTYSSVVEDISTVGEGGEEELRPDRRWWFRLYYASPQAFVMQLYDSGESGDTYKYAAYVFIPRLVWPDKPATDPGGDVQFLLTGLRNSSTGIGVFAEGYWMLGWLGVGLMSAIMGGVLFFGDRLAWLVVFERRFELFPGLVQIILVGLYPDGWMVSWTASVIFCLLFLGVAWVVVTLAGKRARPPRFA
jgi:hypothetical protein